MSGRRLWRERLGLMAREPDGGILFVGEDRGAFDALGPLVDALSRRYDRVPVAICAADPSLRAWLAERFPGARVMAMPLDFGPAARGFLRRANVRVAAFVETGASAPPALLRGLRRRAVSIVALSGRGAGRRALDRATAAACEARLVVGDQAADAEDESACFVGIEPAVDILGEMLARDLKQRRAERSRRLAPFRLLARLTREPRWRRLIGWRLRRYRDAAALAEALGHPQTILCLGNGPSSEDPALAGMSWDALFRVNHGWIKRGLYLAPDVVFTGGRSTIAAVRGAAFGLPTEYAEAWLAALRVFDPLAGPARFFDVHDVSGEISAFDWGALRPTNGATMIAVAAALRPARLIVAGIDLFQHPLGSYPGDSATRNAYTPGHSRDKEVDFLLSLFDSYPGELVIVGEVLRAEWERRRAGAVETSRPMRVNSGV